MSTAHLTAVLHTARLPNNTFSCPGFPLSNHVPDIPTSNAGFDSRIRFVQCTFILQPTTMSLRLGFHGGNPCPLAHSRLPSSTNASFGRADTRADTPQSLQLAVVRQPSVTHTRAHTPRRQGVRKLPGRLRTAPAPTVTRRRRGAFVQALQNERQS